MLISLYYIEEKSEQKKQYNNQKRPKVKTNFKLKFDV